MSKFNSALREMSETTKTQLWSDSCSISELNYALGHGAVGATTNPVILEQTLRRELETYIPLIKRLIADNPTAGEDEITWLLVDRMVAAGALLFEPLFRSTNGQAGYMSVQTNPKYYRDAKKMAGQAVHFQSLAPNMMVKIPATAAGVEAIEELAYSGVNVISTASFTVSQALAVAESVERAMERRAGEGLDNSKLRPMCAILVGRVEDWLRDAAGAEGIVVDPDALCMSGVAVFKQAYKIYQKRGYRTRLLAAAYRNHFHWSEFIGGDVSLTISHKWMKNFAESDITAEPRMDNPVDAKLLGQLERHFPDFRRAYEPDGIKPEEFDHFGATRKTLAQFLKVYDDMVAVVRNYMLGA